jgi:heme oxygenase
VASPDLPDLLKDATRDLHAQAERAGVMGELLHGRIGHAAYCAMLRNLHAIYEVLEAALDALPADAGERRLWHEGLRRGPALAQDLDRLHGRGWQDTIALAPATRLYLARLRALAPGRIAAHAYVRYLGDLNGGQMLARLVRARFGLDRGEGTAFYDFGTPEHAAALRAQFRSALASLPLTADEAGALADESRWAFEAHRRLFIELQAA